MAELSVQITVFQDGENDGDGRTAIEAGIQRTWSEHYAEECKLIIIPGFVNLKQQPDAVKALPILRNIYAVRNPDLFFLATFGSKQAELGGVEITSHSPDGSNVDKRYPFLWAAGQWPVHAFVVTPYMKQRPNGQQNCLPHRHAKRNQRFVAEWNPSDPSGSVLRQILPLRDLQVGSGTRLPPGVNQALFDWKDLGAFFAHTAAAKLLGEQASRTASRELTLMKERLTNLVSLCLANTRDTEPSSLIMQPGKWTQVYNTRPETGHWERGEGQFDSIDGRIMFTADELSEIPKSKRPSFEFWVPQMTSVHPWIAEQRERGFGSKRLRNLLVVLAPFCTAKFSDQLSSADWDVLRDNPQVLLERLDWPPGLYRIADLVGKGTIDKIATRGLNSPDPKMIARIKELLSDSHLYYASYRPYGDNWAVKLKQSLKGLTSHSKILVPRIPKALLAPLVRTVPCTLVAAEQCEFSARLRSMSGQE